MTGKLRVVEAEHPERGRLFAAIDPSVRFVEAAVAELRFGAFLTPFASEEAARAALEAAGASIEGQRP